MDRQRQPSDAPLGAACIRCGGTRLVIEGDGPPVCRLCIYAWTSFARLAAPTGWLMEPGRAELEHRARHRALASVGCVYCTSGR
jgi:hypothetical protein